MKKYSKAFQNASLFEGMAEEEIYSMLNCLNAVMKDYDKGQYVYQAGDRITRMAMILEGAIHIDKEDYWGNRSIIAEITPGDFFGEVYACLDDEPSAINAAAAKRSKIMFMDMKKVFSTCTAVCPYHAKLIQNFIKVMAHKNKNLTRKMVHLTQRSTRDKLLSYLSEQSMKNGTASFDIPFDRQQLADFLSVDRSAMSKELGRLKKEGIIDFKKNHFILMAKDDQEQ